jgi:hypothetical protein
LASEIGTMKIVSLGLEDHGLRTLLNAAIASSRLDGVFILPHSWSGGWLLAFSGDECGQCTE